MKKRELLKRILILIFVLYIFMLSIKLMGGAFKLFGKGFAESLITFTDNSLIALFIGILATALVQSSSVSTSLVVGLVASSAISVHNAIPMIMGANIGTSITNTMVSLGHLRNKKEFRDAFAVATVHDFFNLIAVLVLLPLELVFGILEKSAVFLTQFVIGKSTSTFNSPLNSIINPFVTIIQNILGNKPILILLISIIAIYLSLHFFVKVMRPLTETEFTHLLKKHIFEKPLRSFSFGVVLTIMAQSSSITTSLVVPLAGLGIVDIYAVFPYILGANIGTTITALLASAVTGSAAAVTIALAHLLFNLYGIAIIYPLRKIPIALARRLAQRAHKSSLIPISYIVFFFYILPMAFIYLAS